MMSYASYGSGGVLVLGCSARFVSSALVGHLGLGVSSASPGFWCSGFQGLVAFMAMGFISPGSRRSGSASPGFALRLRASRVCLPASLAMTAQRHSSIMLAFVLSVMCFTLTATGGMAPRGLPSGLGAALELGWNGEIGAESWVAFPGFGSTAHCHGGLVGLDLLGLEGSAFAAIVAGVLVLVFVLAILLGAFLGLSSGPSATTAQQVTSAVSAWWARASWCTALCGVALLCGFGLS